MIAQTLVNFLLTTLILGSVPGNGVLVINQKNALNQWSLPTEQSVRSLPLSEDRTAWPKLKDQDSRGMLVTAESAIVMDRESRKILFEKNVDEKRPIASITKLMTALVFLETKPNFSKSVSVEAIDETVSSGAYFHAGEQLTIKDVFYASLVGSANDAAQMLMRLSGISREKFIGRMNQKAREIGMDNTTFVEPTGLDARNVSTARDLTHLLLAAREAREIRQATEMKTYIVPFATPRKIESTDLLLTSFLNQDPYEIIVGKTGSLDEAGFCFVTSVDRGQHGVLVISLGSKTHYTRFNDAKALAYWAFTRWQWKDELARAN